MSVQCSVQDAAFKTPARSILRREHILRETDPVATGNTTARNIYSPIVRFLTPSKESKYGIALIETGKSRYQVSPTRPVFLTLCARLFVFSVQTWRFQTEEMFWWVQNSVCLVWAPLTFWLKMRRRTFSTREYQTFCRCSPHIYC